VAGPMVRGLQRMPLVKASPPNTLQRLSRIRALMRPAAIVDQPIETFRGKYAPRARALRVILPDGSVPVKVSTRTHRFGEMRAQIWLVPYARPVSRQGATVSDSWLLANPGGARQSRRKASTLS